VGSLAYVADGDDGLVILRIGDKSADSPESAVLLAPPQSTPGNITQSRSAEWFKFPAVRGERYVVEAIPGTFADITVRLLAPDGRTILAGDENGGPARIEWLASTTGTCYVRVAALGQATGSYTLSIAGPVLIQGTAGDDARYVNLDPTSRVLQVFDTETPSGAPIYSQPVAMVTGLRVDGGGGDDTITIDAQLPFNPVVNATPRTGIVRISAGTCVFEASQHLRALSIGPGASLSFMAGGGKVLRTSALGMADDAVLDLADNTLIIDAGDDAKNVLAEITAKIGTARNTMDAQNRLWHGPGITSSAACDDATTLHGLAVLLNRDDLGNPIYPGYDTNTIIVKYALNGDMDMSGEVNALDYARINQGFLSQNTPDVLGGYQNGDLDFSGEINALDYALINGAFLGQHQFQPPGAPARPAPASKVLPPAAKKADRRKAVVGRQKKRSRFVHEWTRRDTNHLTTDGPGGRRKKGELSGDRMANRPTASATKRPAWKRLSAVVV
jgi:hypothetical protein